MNIKTTSDSDGYFILECPIESILHFYVDKESYSKSVCELISSKDDNKEKLPNIELNQKVEYNPFLLVASYNINIEGITIDRINYYRMKNKDISFVIKGMFFDYNSFKISNYSQFLVIEDNVTGAINKYDFNKFSNAFIICSPLLNKYIFILN